MSKRPATVRKPIAAPRPKLTDDLEVLLTFRATTKMREQLRIAAYKARRPPSVYVRLLLEDALKGVRT